MSKDKTKPKAVLEAEAHGGESFTHDSNLCPDCKGLGIRNPEVDSHVCQTCAGSGKLA